MSVKDPHINQICLSLKATGEPESKTFGEKTVKKAKAEVWQLTRDRETKEYRNRAYDLEVKGWGKAAEAIGKLKAGDVFVAQGRLEADLFVYNEKDCQKMFLNAFTITAFEFASAPPKAKTEAQAEVEQGATEDDIPF